MYQRLRVLSSLDRSAVLACEVTCASLTSKTEYELHDVPDDRVGDEEEHRGQGDHDQHHGRGDPDLFPGRPRDLRYFLANLFDEGKRVLHTSAHDPERHA